ncbi:serine protease 30-like [Clavelina lepadiformis]|uniref:serine protease 30-like n=1 Tax=Clavelina lepadiformis TaxID=159417 RepID=UPI0040427928
MEKKNYSAGMKKDKKEMMPMESTSIVQEEKVIGKSKQSPEIDRPSTSVESRPEEKRKKRYRTNEEVELHLKGQTSQKKPSQRKPSANATPRISVALNPESLSSMTTAPKKITICIVLSIFLGCSIGAGVGYGVYVWSHAAKGSDREDTSIPQTVNVYSSTGSNVDSGNGNRGSGNGEGTSELGRVWINSENCGRLHPSVRNPYDDVGRFARSIDERIQARVVGGMDASIDQHPWQVSLWTRGHTCGGSIIASNWILFAAHCVDAYPHPENWTVYAGVNDRRDMMTKAQKAFVTDVISHWSFNLDTYDSDIALLRLDRHFTLNKDVKTICLPSDRRHVENGTVCQISGWGATSEGSSLPFILQDTFVEIIDHGTCNQANWLSGLVNDKMFCAGAVDGSKDACQGDSGGPLACLDHIENRSYLMGAVSWGIGCGEAFMPGVYTRIPTLVSWVKKTMNDVEAKYSSPTAST